MAKPIVEIGQTQNADLFCPGPQAESYCSKQALVRGGLFASSLSTVSGTGICEIDTFEYFV